MTPAWWLAVLAAFGLEAHPPKDPHHHAREEMITRHIQNRGITDPAVLQALREVPREEFVPETLRPQAYEDNPLPIGHNQTISQPYIVALMTQLLALKPTDRVLEIGTGSGYQAAILGQLAAAVYSLEIIEPLAREARKTLERLGFRNVHVRTGDGYLGWPEESPFDAIIVTCAPDHVPPALIDQLREGGRMAIPVGPEGGVQDLFLLEKSDGTLKKHSVIPVRFVPLTRPE